LPRGGQRVQQAKTNPKMKNGYVKVGLIDGALVLRCKEKKFLGDIEVDATLVTDYKGKTWPLSRTCRTNSSRNTSQQQELAC
jgi:hypothetical protein